MRGALVHVSFFALPCALAAMETWAASSAAPPDLSASLAHDPRRAFCAVTVRQLLPGVLSRLFRRRAPEQYVEVLAPFDFVRGQLGLVRVDMDLSGNTRMRSSWPEEPGLQTDRKKDKRAITIQQQRFRHGLFLQGNICRASIARRNGFCSVMRAMCAPFAPHCAPAGLADVSGSGGGGDAGLTPTFTCAIARNSAADCTRCRHVS